MSWSQETGQPPPDLVATLRRAGCVFAEEEAGLLAEAARSTASLRAMTRRRMSGEPLEQVLGWAWFCGLRVRLQPGVFVPRRRSELLVREVAAVTGPGQVVVDLCCGSGAVGLAVDARVAQVALHAADIDATAVRCAWENLAPVGAHVHHGDLFGALPDRLRGRVDVVVACPPYVPAAAVPLMPPEARDHEPRPALDGGTDGLDVVRRLAADAPAWLRRGGRLVVETSVAQAPVAARAMAGHGLRPRVVHGEDLGATAVVGRRE